MVISQAFAHYCLDEIRLKGGAQKTIQNYQSALNSLLGAVSDMPVELVTYELIIQWKVEMDRRGMAGSTIAGNLSKLRQVLKYLKKHNHTVLDPRDIELPRIIVKEPDYLDYGEVIKMVEHPARLRDKALIATLFSSGGRISEVLGLDWGDIVDNKAVVLGKNSKYVTLYIDRLASQLLSDYRASRSDLIPAVFISSQMRRLTVQRAEQIVSQISGELGIAKHVTPHTFRHSYATDLLKNGSDLLTVQELLHHSSITTTMRYLHLTDKRKEENYSKYHSA